jgi:hypothetical protein
MVWTLSPLFRIGTPWDWVLMGGVVLVIGVGAVLLQVGERSADRKRTRRRKRRVRR